MDIKCVVWDLDNTLWLGTLSENQPLKLNDHVVELIKMLNNKGIVNSICSKNNEDAAKRQLAEYKIKDLFILPKINWNKKSENIRLLINQLKFREENILFVDDLNFELDQVKSVLPKIMTLNIKELKKLTDYVGALPDRTSEEAVKRIDFYKVEERRIKDQTQHQLSNQEFLKTCNINVIVESAKVTDIVRIQELIDRTNQINSSGIRYSEKEVIECIEDEHQEVFIASVKDKYGDYGKSALLIAEKTQNTYTVKLLIVSCRLLGKSIAQFLLYFAFSRARVLSKNAFCCEYKKTSSNRKILLLYKLNEMTCVNNKNGVLTYRLLCENDRVLPPDWINQT